MNFSIATKALLILAPAFLAVATNGSSLRAEQTTSTHHDANKQEGIERDLVATSTTPTPDYYEYLFHPGACRTKNGGHGKEGVDYAVYDDANETTETCRARCSGNHQCLAFEYRGANTHPRCENWYTLPGKYEALPDFKCYHKRHFYEPKELVCSEVHRRYVYGPGDYPKTVTRDGGYKELAYVNSPFGYEFPDVKEGYQRWWRAYAIYNDEYTPPSSSGDAYDVNVQIKFAFDNTNQHDDNDIVFTLLRVNALEYSSRAEGYSDWYKFGAGTKYDTVKHNAKAYGQLYSIAPYNNHGQIRWVDLVAYDCYDEQKH